MTSRGAMTIVFPCGRLEALQRWFDFQPALADYSRRRNFVEENHSNVSRLSPAIRCRLITEKELLDSLRNQLPFSHVEKFVQELLWRGYWKAWMENHAHVWSGFQLGIRSVRDRLSKSEQLRVEDVQLGRSGVAVMDQFARELVETGYLHNHARMWWASFWIHVEKLPWQLGAEFFQRHLLDADPASNTLSWRWVAGLQTRGKTYLVGRSNIQQYLSPRLLDPTGLDRLDEAIDLGPICADENHPMAAPRVTGDDPWQTAHRWGLWLHEEDLNPETGGFPGQPPVSLFAHSGGEPGGDEQASFMRREYQRRAVTDGFVRARAFFRPLSDSAEAVERGSLAESIESWVKRERLDAVWTMRPFIGPLNDRLNAIATAVRKAGAKLIMLDRAWDQYLRGFAVRGYFPFWEKVRKEIAW